MNDRQRRALVAGGGGLAIAGTAWAATLRADRRAVAADSAGVALRRELGGERMTVVAADGTELAVTVHGPSDAPTLVLVHGWTCAQRFWTLQIQALRSETRVVTYDLRGHGDSARAASGDYSIDAFASDLDAVLRATVPAGERSVVAGHSLGGMTIVAWAGQHADEVRERLSAAALINSGMGDLITESLVVRTPTALKRLQGALGRAFLSARAPLPRSTTPVSHRVIRRLALSPAASPAAVAFCEELVLSCANDVRAACGGTLSELDMYEAVSRLAVPTVIVAGAADRLTPPVHSEKLAETLPVLVGEVLIPNAGHMSPVSDAEHVNEALRGLVHEYARMSLAA
jgi:pimeloyl-ACP methyl ester carboxylesterase